MPTKDRERPPPSPPDYPKHWEADVLLRDGRTAHLRPILTEDAEGLVEFYTHVSEESKYFRFFAPMPTLSDKDVERFTNVDYHERVAFVMTLAQKIVAVGRYDVVEKDADSARAEVAFLVQDAHQGRGIAQLLLEHLAQAGRERGVDRFVAEVLPDNRRMIQMFQEQGYPVKGGWDEGVMHLEFDIDPTDTAIGVIAAREHRSEAASIAAFLNARSVAVIGASRRSDTIGALLVRNLVLGDYAGRVYVVNPAADSVAGMPSYPTVGDIPGDVEVAIVAVPAEAVQDVVLDCAAKGVHGLIVISSGFAETGEEGRKRQRKLVGLARSYGLRLIGPNCLGIINTASEVSLNASLAPVMPPRGRAGFFCQSGALGSAILEKVRGRGLGLSTFVSAGNRADVSGNDLLQYWEEDKATTQRTRGATQQRPRQASDQSRRCARTSTAGNADSNPLSGRSLDAKIKPSRRQNCKQIYDAFGSVMARRLIPNASPQSRSRMPRGRIYTFPLCRWRWLRRR